MPDNNWYCKAVIMSNPKSRPWSEKLPKVIFNCLGFAGRSESRYSKEAAGENKKEKVNPNPRAEVQVFIIRQWKWWLLNLRGLNFERTVWSVVQRDKATNFTKGQVILCCGKIHKHKCPWRIIWMVQCSLCFGKVTISVIKAALMCLSDAPKVSL